MSELFLFLQIISFIYNMTFFHKKYNPFFKYSKYAKEYIFLNDLNLI